MYSEKFFKNSIKLLRSQFPVADLFIRRALKGHLGTQVTRTLEHLRHSGTRRALGHLGTQGTCVLGHLKCLGTWALIRQK